MYAYGRGEARYIQSENIQHKMSSRTISLTKYGSYCKVQVDVLLTSSNLLLI